MFGLGDFGFEMNVGPGWELAPFGYGPFGCGGEPFVWRIEESDAVDTFVVELVDREGAVLSTEEIGLPL